MIKTESKAIGERGYTYTVQQFGARQGMRMLVRLAKMLGKPVGDAVSAGESLDLKAAGSLISGLAQAITEEEFDAVCTAFAKCSVVSGGDASQAAAQQYGSAVVPLKDAGIFDLHFAGAYTEMMAWLAFALGVNYTDFLAAVTAAKSDLLTGLRDSPAGVVASASPSPSPTT